MTHKIAMRRRLADAGVAQPEFAALRTLQEARVAVETVGLPAVLKPANTGGQRDIHGEQPMSTVSPPATAPAPIPARRSGFGGYLLAEWTKIRSVRSTVWTLISFVVVSLGLTALLTWLTLNALNNGRRGQAASGIVTENLIVGSVFLDDENDVLERRMRWASTCLIPTVIASDTPAELCEIGRGWFCGQNGESAIQLSEDVLTRIGS